MTDQIRKNIIWNAFGNVVFLAGQWLITILVTRLMGYEEAGMLSLAMSTSSVFQTLALFGIRNFQISDINNKYSDNCYVMLRNITCFFAFLLCMIFAIICRYNLLQIISIFWFMLFRLSENYADVLHGILQKKGKLFIVGQSYLIRGIVILLGFFFGKYIFGTLNGELFIIALFSWLTTIIFDYRIVHKISSFSQFCAPISCIALAKETFLLCIYSFLSNVMYAAPKFILEKMCDEATLGAYSSVFAPVLLLQAVAMYIYVPIIPKFAELFYKNNLRKFWQIAAKIILLFIVGEIIAIIFSFLLGEQVLIILFGKSISKYCNLLIPIIICIFSMVLYVFLQSLMVVMRNFKTLIVSCLIGVFVSGISSVLFINLASANGASFGLIAGTMCGVLYIVVSLMLKSKLKRSEMK